MLKDLVAYRRAPEFMENRRLFESYPDFITSLVTNIFTVNGGGPAHLYSRVLTQMKQSKVSLAKLAVDSWKGATWL